MAILPDVKAGKSTADARSLGRSGDPRSQTAPLAWTVRCQSKIRNPARTIGINPGRPKWDHLLRQTACGRQSYR